MLDTIIQYSLEIFGCDKNILEKFRCKFFAELEKDKSKLASMYVVNMINNLFKQNMLKQSKDIDIVKEELEEISSTEHLDQLYKDYLNKLEEVILQKDYDNAIKICNYKNKLINSLTRIIINNYADRIINRLVSDKIFRQTVISVCIPEIELQNLSV